jgi:membrane protein DedA with SNARE-associated domain
MLKHIALLILQSALTSRKVSHFFLHLGGVGLIPLGLLDGSVIPIPGSMDVVTVILAAHDPTIWIYYALMATVGSVAGEYLTFQLARRHTGKPLVRKLPFGRIVKYKAIFERWGFSAIAVPALLPPPMPMVPFVVAAGTLNYPRGRFLTAVTVGRVARYSILGFLGAHYGRHIVRIVARYGWRILYVTAAIVVVAVIVLLIRKMVVKPQPQGVKET